MCIICVLFEAEKLTKAEALKAGMEELPNAKTDKEIDHLLDILDEIEYGTGEDNE